MLDNEIHFNCIRDVLQYVIHSEQIAYHIKLIGSWDKWTHLKSIQSFLADFNAIEPSSITLGSPSTTTLDVSWTHGSPNMNGYNVTCICKTTENCVNSSVITAAASEFSVTCTDLSAGKDN